MMTMMMEVNGCATWKKLLLLRCFLFLFDALFATASGCSPTWLINIRIFEINLFCLYCSVKITCELLPRCDFCMFSDGCSICWLSDLSPYAELFSVGPTLNFNLRVWNYAKMIVWLSRTDVLTPKFITVNWAITKLLFFLLLEVWLIVFRCTRVCGLDAPL